MVYDLHYDVAFCINLIYTNVKKHKKDCFDNPFFIIYYIIINKKNKLIPKESKVW